MFVDGEGGGSGSHWREIKGLNDAHAKVFAGPMVVRDISVLLCVPVGLSCHVPPHAHSSQ